MKLGSMVSPQCGQESQADARALVHNEARGIFDAQAPSLSDEAARRRVWQQAALAHHDE